MVSLCGFIGQERTSNVLPPSTKAMVVPQGRNSHVIIICAVVYPVFPPFCQIIRMKKART